MNGLITLTFTGFPNGYCYPGDPNDYFFDGISATVVSFNTSTGNLYYNIGPTVPSVDNRIYPWYRCGVTDNWEGWYFWGPQQGLAHAFWLQRHPEEASSDKRVMWVGSDPADIDTYDGGEVGAVTDITGPFWEIDHDFDARIPIGVGTTTGGTVIQVNTDSGADTFSLTYENIPAHYHYINVEGDSALTPETESEGYLRVGAGTEVDWVDGSGPKDGMGKTYNQVNDGTTPEPVTHLGPVRGVYVIKRTARVYRVQA